MSQKQIPKVFTLLETLTPAEWKRFDAFVRSPFFHTHEPTLRYWELVEPGPPVGEPDRQAAFAQVYPGEPYDDGKLRTLRKYLLRLLEDFVVQLALEADPEHSQRKLVEAVAARGLQAWVPRLLSRSREALEALPHRNEHYFSERFYLERLAFQHKLTHGQRLTPRAFGEMMAPLDHSYLVQKLNYGCAALNQQGATMEIIPLLAEVRAYCRATTAHLPPVVRAYFYALELIAGSSDEAGLDALLDLVRAEAAVFHRADLINVLGYAINYCNRRYRAGAQTYLRRMLDIYRLMLDLDLLFEQGTLSTHQYKNIATLGLRLGEYGWTGEFIERYRERLDPAYRDGVYHYNRAHLLSYQEQYSEALRHLQEVDFLDPYYRISYYLLLLKIYYECREIEPLLSLVETFRTFLRRKQQLPESQRQTYLNFARHIRALFLVEIGRKHQLDQVEAAIRSSRPLIEREWLLAKAAALRETQPWRFG